MLCVNNYTQKYIDECRLKVNVQLSTYKNLKRQINTDANKLNSTIESFETNFFNNMILVLDALFVHRSSTIELNDGNPLNEVRILCHSIINSNNKMTAPYKSTKYIPDKSVLKYQIGDEIKLNEADFLLIFKAFFTEIENKYL